MRLLTCLVIAAAAALGGAGCTQDTALGDPVAPTSPSTGSLPPVGHGGPLDHQGHPAAVRGTSAGMAGGDAASGTLARPIEASENTGFASDPPSAPGGDGAPSAQSDGAPIATGSGDTASTERDRELNQRIRLALADDRSLAAAVTRLRLVTVDGVVTLQGQVATTNDKEQLELAVAAQEGVKKVQNHVAVGAQ